MKDEENKFAHKVNSDDYNAWWYDRSTLVRAACGKVWAPTMGHADAAKKVRCRECFPVYAMSA